MLAPTVKGDVPISRVILRAVHFICLALGERWLGEAETERAFVLALYPLSHAVACRLPPRGSLKGAMRFASLPQRGRLTRFANSGKTSMKFFISAPPLSENIVMRGSS